MRCTQCAAVSFSAAARTLVERGERCPQCGGEVALVQEPVAVVAEGAKAQDAADGTATDGKSQGRRFDRE